MPALVPMRIFFLLDFRGSFVTCIHGDLFCSQGHLAPQWKNSITIVLSFPSLSKCSSNNVWSGQMLELQHNKVLNHASALSSLPFRAISTIGTNDMVRELKPKCEHILCYLRSFAVTGIVPPWHRVAVRIKSTYMHFQSHRTFWPLVKSPHISCIQDAICCRLAEIFLMTFFFPQGYVYQLNQLLARKELGKVVT